MDKGFKQVKNIAVEAAARDGSTIVVVSAFKGVTDRLIALGINAKDGKKDEVQTELDSLKGLHLEKLEEFVPDLELQATTRAEIEACFQELSVLTGGCSAIRVLPPKTKDQIVGSGEWLSGIIFDASLRSDGSDSEFVDARELVRTNDRYGDAVVDEKETDLRISKYFAANRRNISVVTGFRGSAPDGSTTTLGRGGSDSTAALIAAATNARELQLYKEVDGVLSADPKNVDGTISVEKLSYGEMRALAVAGAKVIHPPSALPVERKKIPVRVLNVFNPSHPGTLINAEKNKEEREVKVVSSLNNVTIITIGGSAIHEGAGVDDRVTGSTTRAGANVLMKTQANEDSITVVVSNDDAEKAMAELTKEFANESGRDAVSIECEPNHAILAVVGAGMKDRAGVSARLFTTLAKSGVSVHVIAQDAKELCIAVAIPQEDLRNALQVVHDEFVLEQKVVSFIVIGPGRVGREVVTRIAALREEHLKHHGVQFRLVGIIGSTRMIISANGGIPFESWEKELEEHGEAADFENFVDRFLDRNDPHRVALETSASQAPVEYYKVLAEENVGIVTANKKSLTGTMGEYEEIFDAVREGNTTFAYGATVGAGLGAIDKIRNDRQGGDVVQSIEGMLSGTLGYIFSNFNGTRPFSEVVMDAFKNDLTEPNPADDLSLADVRRKLLILAREAGANLEESDIRIITFLSDACLSAQNAEEFFRELKKEDDQMGRRYQEADAEGKRLRVIARYEPGKSSIELVKVGPNHPAYSLSGPKNLIAATTRDRPDGWSISGAGAGIKVTSSAVIAGLVQVAKNS